MQGKIFHKKKNTCTKNKHLLNIHTILILWLPNCIISFSRYIWLFDFVGSILAQHEKKTLLQLYSLKAQICLLVYVAGSGLSLPNDSYSG